MNDFLRYFDILGLKGAKENECVCEQHKILVKSRKNYRKKFKIFVDTVNDRRIMDSVKGADVFQLYSVKGKTDFFGKGKQKK